MAVFTKSTVDGTTNTAALEIYVDAVLITTYAWTGTAFTLSERLTDTTVTEGDLGANTMDIESWHTSVLRACPVVEVFDPHAIDIDDKTSRVVYKLRFGEDSETMAAHVIFRKTPIDYEFKARAALSLTPREFRLFVRVLRFMLTQPTGDGTYGV